MCSLRSRGGGLSYVARIRELLECSSSRAHTELTDPRGLLIRDVRVVSATRQKSPPTGGSVHGHKPVAATQHLADNRWRKATVMKARSGRSARVGVALASVCLVAATTGPAAARWSVHDPSTATEIAPPPGLGDREVCRDQVRGLTGWAASIDEEQDPTTVPLPTGAFTAMTYEVYQGPPGSFLHVDSPDGEQLLRRVRRPGRRLPAGSAAEDLHHRAPQRAARSDRHGARVTLRVHDGSVLRGDLVGPAG